MAAMPGPQQGQVSAEAAQEAEEPPAKALIGPAMHPAGEHA